MSGQPSWLRELQFNIFIWERAKTVYCVLSRAALRIYSESVGQGMQLGTVASCNLALKTCPVHFLCHRICITLKSLCQQTGHMLHSRYGEQMRIAYELYVVMWLPACHLKTVLITYSIVRTQ